MICLRSAVTESIVAARLPTETETVGPKFVPVIVKTVPPTNGPELGKICEIVGFAL